MNNHYKGETLARKLELDFFLTTLAETPTVNMYMDSIKDITSQAVPMASCVTHEEEKMIFLTFSNSSHEVYENIKYDHLFSNDIVNLGLEYSSNRTFVRCGYWHVEAILDINLITKLYQ